jgi:NADH dehydrogenase/NADH:ubiquinone oxidoreductase subunit G
MASQVKESMTETATTMASQAGEKVEQAVDMAKQETASRLEAERERVAESLYTTAHALRKAGQQLREQEQGSIATVADRIAQRAENASGYLRSRDLPRLIDDTEQLGRTHPMLFAGGALGLGLLGVRFLKSSRKQQTATPPRSAAFEALNASRPDDSFVGTSDTLVAGASSSFASSGSTLSSVSSAETSDLEDPEQEFALDTELDA